MTGAGPRNVAASVRDRLRTLAHQRGEQLEYLLLRYASERLLYRLAQSQYRTRFVLKGAMLLELWDDVRHRPTRDVDLLSVGDNGPNSVAAVFRDLCAVPVPDDWLTFDVGSVVAEAIMAPAEYPGVRVRPNAHLTTAIIELQFDVGFGDALTLPTPELPYPTLLGQPSPVLRTYPPETVIAEKFEAVVDLGMLNSRLKDLYDLWPISNTRTFSGPPLAEAISATFERRGTPLPSAVPTGLTPAFATAHAAQWQGFVRRTGLSPVPRSLSEVQSAVACFRDATASALASGLAFTGVWTPTEGWH